MNIHVVVPEGYFGSNCYIVEDNGVAVVIDPSVNYQTLVKKIGNLDIKGVLLTHAHFDHIIGAQSFTEAKIPIYVGEKDKLMLSDSYYNCYLGFLGVNDGYYGNAFTLSDGDTLEFGAIRVHVISTPGHTPGGLTYKIGNNVFVGDTLFENGGYGRCDLPLGDIDVLEKSLIKLFARFKDEIFYPGHGNSSTFSECIKYFN